MKDPADEQCFDIPDPTTFHVRIGPNYPRNKKKAPSNGAILEVLCADLFICDKKIDHIMQYLQFPDVPYEVWVVPVDGA